MGKRLVVKGFVILGLILLLMIPTLMISNLVSEREYRQEEAFREISSKWAINQTVTGPVVSIPYYEYFKDENGKVQRSKSYIHVLPDELNISGTLSPEKRYRGIYEIVVYESALSFSGHFSGLRDNSPQIADENILYDQAFVSLGITDLRGIEENLTLKWNGQDHYFNSGVETEDVIASGINAPITLVQDTGTNEYAFSFDIALKGSQYLYFSPIGKETKVNIRSNWPTPSFDGAFLPDTREVSNEGFKAYWKVLHLNRNYPQRWTGGNQRVEESSFGINLLLPVDNYTKTDRAIKYAILFIALTFLIFFFLELLNNKSIHPLQYILIGFALCIFYVLLLSISEHMYFDLAYLVAAVMTIGLIWWYSRSILKDRKLAALVGGNLVILYGFIYTLLQIQDYALLMGSLGLFVILTVVMYFSKKIDWAAIGRRDTGA